MIKAELSYNPYLCETEVRFNGQPPRINSLIEKYQNVVLQDWINELPQIFHDEMNGYDFELEFCGTELDLAEIEGAFRRAGVSEDEVRIFQKNDIECREVKIERIRDLLEWLGNNRYRKFDLDSFRFENSELFDGDHVGIVLHGSSCKPQLKDVALESVADVRELERTDLTHTPILCCVTEDTLPTLRADLKYLRGRNDAHDRQLFFRIDDGMSAEKLSRHLTDIGLPEPTIVKDINDEAVKKYFLLYPFSDYIASAVKAFRKVTDELTDALNAENDKNRTKSLDVHEQLDKIGDNIRLLKEADEKVREHDNLYFPPEFDSSIEELINKLQTWESRKTKIINDYNSARIAATNFNSAMQRAFADFCSQVKTISEDYARQIRNMYETWYKNAEPEENYNCLRSFLSGLFVPHIDDKINDLLALKEESYVERKGSLLGQIFGSSDNGASSAPVLETTYYYQAWRNYMIDTVKPEAERLTKERFEMLNRYSAELANDYHGQLQKLLKRKQSQKEYVAMGLSEEEKVLKKDNDWLNTFTDKLKYIERS